MRDYSTAETLYRRILASRDRDVTMHWSEVARVLLKLATSQRLRGDLASARRTYDEVLSILEPHVARTVRPGWAVQDGIAVQTLRELGALAVASGDVPAAGDYLRRARPLDD